MEKTIEVIDLVNKYKEIILLLKEILFEKEFDYISIIDIYMDEKSGKVKIEYERDEGWGDLSYGYIYVNIEKFEYIIKNKYEG